MSLRVRDCIREHRGKAQGQRFAVGSNPGEWGVEPQCVVCYGWQFMDYSIEKKNLEQPNLLIENQGSHLAELLALIPDLIWVRKPGTWGISYCSPACESFWGQSSEDLHRRPTAWLESIHADDQEQVKAALAQADADGELLLEYRVVRPDKTIRWIHDRARLCREGENSGLVGIARDITGSKRSEIALRAAYDALHSSVNGMIITDPAGRITYTNPSFLRLFGYTSEEEALGQKANGLFAREDLEEISDVAAEIAKTGARAREFRMKRRDGSDLVVEVMSSDIQDTQGRKAGSMASFSDITIRKQLEHEADRRGKTLQLLTERMAQVEEQERRRIAGQLHDTAVQSFSLANIKLGAVQSALERMGDAGQDRDELATVRNLITRGIAECRLIMADLIPPLLYEVGLQAALRECAETLQNLYHSSIKVEGEDDAIAIPDSLRGMVFQVARELIINACKHADASRISVSWSQSIDCFRMRVSDDGKGFDPKLQEGYPKQIDSGGFGLFSIRERLRGAEGRLNIRSKPDSGSEFEVIVPLKTRQAEERE